MGVEYIGSYVSSDSVLLFLCATRYAEQEGWGGEEGIGYYMRLRWGTYSVYNYITNKNPRGDISPLMPLHLCYLSFCPI